MSRASSERTKRGPKNGRQAEPYQFSSLDAAELLLGLIIGMAMDGGAIRVGLTRDMGALAIGIYKGEEYGTEYIRPNEDLSNEVRSISQGWNIPMAVWDDEADCWIVV